MTRVAPLFLIAAFASLFLFPWPVAALFALVAAPGLPVAPAAVGVAFDVLYLAPGALPLASGLGALAALVALFVRARLAAGIMER